MPSAGSHGPDDVAGEVDLDDIGALVGENHRGQGWAHVGGQIDDPGAGERSPRPQRPLPQRLHLEKPLRDLTRMSHREGLFRDATTAGEDTRVVTDAATPLSGTRVIDLTTNMSGPLATMVLADQGADVVKVEPLTGDVIRTVGTGHDGMSAYFANVNRAKRSIAIDLSQPAGRGTSLPG